jgi:hypothetical protein
MQGGGGPRPSVPREGRGHTCLRRPVLPPWCVPVWVWGYPAMGQSVALFSLKKLQNFLDFSSHRVLKYMHGVLNIDEYKN